MLSLDENLSRGNYTKYFIYKLSEKKNLNFKEISLCSYSKNYFFENIISYFFESTISYFQRNISLKLRYFFQCNNQQIITVLYYNNWKVIITVHEIFIETRKQGQKKLMRLK